MPWVVPAGSAGRLPEGFVLDPDGIVGAPVDLGTVNGQLRLSSLTIPPAQKQPVWASNDDSDGQTLVRVPFYANRECQMQVRVNVTSGDDAMYAIGVLESKLQEADRLAEQGGLPALWTPTGASTGLTLYLLLAQITDMPVTIDDGWFAHKPILTVAFSCKPFLYGEETSVTQVTSTDPVLSITVPDVAGDVRAEGRLVVTIPGSTQPRRFLEWGLEQMYYDPSANPLIDSASMTTTGYAGSPLAHTGAYGGTTIAASLYSRPVAVCSTGDLPHVGSFRVKARIYAETTAEYWRLSWQDGDGPFYANDYVQPVTGGAFNEVDLGIIDVSKAVDSTQKWSGRLEAYTTSTSAETGEVDYLALFPVTEGYGRFADTFSYHPGDITAADDFFDSPGALNGQVATFGGTWATTGAATDFAIPSSPLNVVTRTTTSDSDYRYASLLTGGITATEVGIKVASFGSNASFDSALLARFADANNHLRFRMHTQYGATSTGTFTLYIETVILGATTILAQSPAGVATQSASYELRLIAYDTGRAVGLLLDENGGVLGQVEATSDALLAFAALESGLPGFADRNTGTAAAGRTYQSFYVATPPTESVICYPGHNLEIRSDSNLRQSADNDHFGDIVARGSRFFLPPAGDGNRTSRIVLKGSRDDLSTMSDTTLGDWLQAEVFWTPRYLVVPR